MRLGLHRSSLRSQMLRGMLKERLQHKRLTKQHFQVRLAELIGGHPLQKAQRGLEIHGLEARAEVGCKAGTEVDEKDLKASTPTMIVSHRRMQQGMGRSRTIKHAIHWNAV